jgi:carboxymethylenebutenolidase
MGTCSGMGDLIAVGSGSGYLATPGRGAGPALVVITEPDGPAGDGRDVCDRFAVEGFTALAPEFRPGQTAGDLAAALDLLGPHPAVRGQTAGVVGFSDGAGEALGLAARRPDAVGVVVLFSFSGTVPALAGPDGFHLTAPVQGHFSEDDPSSPPQAASALEDALGEAQVSAEIYTYPNTDGEVFDPARSHAHGDDAARQAWVRTLEFLRRHLG